MTPDVPPSPLPKSFPELTVDTPATRTHPPATLTVSATELRWESDGGWSVPLIEVNLHALSTEPDQAHVYLQIGEDCSEVHIRGDGDALKELYETLCIAVAQCPDENEDAEPALGGMEMGGEAAEMLSRLDGLIQVEDVDKGQDETKDGR